MKLDRFVALKAFGLAKTRGSAKNAKFEVREDAYNFFNKINLNVLSIDPVIGGLSAGSPPMVTPDPHFGSLGYEGQPAALGSRTVQLQARFSS